MKGNTQIFIQTKGKTTLNSNNIIFLKDILDIYTDDHNVKVEIENMIYNLENTKKNTAYVMNVLTIIPLIKNNFPNSNVSIIGEPDILINLEDKQIDNIRKSEIIKYIKVVTVCFLLFVGAATAIINFHSDVDMLQTQKTIYRIITGKESENLLLMQIPYSFGIGIGMSVFFNHFLKKKINNEPSPLEVEVQLYQESLDQYIKKNNNANK